MRDSKSSRGCHVEANVSYGKLAERKEIMKTKQFPCNSNIFKNFETYYYT